MIHEYALDPEAVLLWNDRATRRLVLEAFRSGSGRVPVCLPAKWAGQLVNNADIEDQNERKLFIEFVRALDLRKSNRQATVWDGQARTWLENILLEHEARPFHAIITPHKVDGCAQAIGVDLDLDTRPWTVPRSLRIPRTAEALANAVAPLLFSTRTVTIVDPVFRPVFRFDAGIQHLLAASTNPAFTTEVRILMREDDGDRPWQAMMERDCDRLARFVPARVILEVIYVPAANIGARLHNRFILTDEGGVMLGDSIDEGEAGEVNDVALLDQAHFAEVQAEANRVIQGERQQRKSYRGP